jgi:hypothetical protein
MVAIVFDTRFPHHCCAWPRRPGRGPDRYTLPIDTNPIYLFPASIVHLGTAAGPTNMVMMVPMMTGTCRRFSEIWPDVLPMLPAVAAMGRPALFLLSMDVVVYLEREPGHAAHKLHGDEIRRCRHPR